MNPNPMLGVVFHWLGGLASGSFYVPYRGVKKWSWETYWLVGGFFSWIIAPWLLAAVMTNDLLAVLQQQSMTTLWWSYFFGAMWGLGGLTFGLTMRYLGMSLGMAIALGYCAAFGTLVPPIFNGTIGQTLSMASGQIILLGVLVCLLGIGIAGLAGMNKEREMPDAEKKASIKEFNFTKGILVGTFSGIFSASFAYALAAAEPIATASEAAGTTHLWTGLPKLVVVLLGGFTSNFIWCVLLNIKNGSGYQYFRSQVRPEHAGLTATGGGEHGGAAASLRRPNVDDLRAPMLANYVFSAMAGLTWYMQFFFYTMGETQMGRYKFSSWTLHMASIIIFSTLWGVALHEWRGSSKKTHALITAGIAVLILSTVIVGYGNKLAPAESQSTAVEEPEPA
ncbi:MAG TPA: L-rhamnose/proton symporter RhaT [Pirellulales bacterium]|jgi:L-rhamnose-H+ transport protein|nr:L-rhamnose/proton symporter RhaT [Pirellulales bacterium]